MWNEQGRLTGLQREFSTTAASAQSILGGILGNSGTIRPDRLDLRLPEQRSGVRRTDVMLGHLIEPYDLHKKPCLPVNG